MRNFYYLITFLFAFYSCNSIATVNDCIASQRSQTVNIIKSKYTVFYTKPQLCKPLLIDGFSAIKGHETSIYTLNWSDTHHDLWHVFKYEVLINGNTEEIREYSSDESLPINIDLSGPGTDSGDLAQFQVRACSSIDDGQELSCGDWQGTSTQCEVECTDNSYEVPSLSSSVDTSSSGDYSIAWNDLSFQAYELQQTSTAGQWQTIQDNDQLNIALVNQANNQTFSYRIRGHNGNIYSRYSQTVDVSVALQVPSISPLEKTSVTGDYRVEWSSVDYQAVRYKLQQSTDGLAWSTIINSDVLFYEFSNQPNNTTYYYRVKACRDNNNCSDFSDHKSVSVELATPQISALPAINTTGNYTVQWSAVVYDDFVERYELQEKLNNGAWSTLSNGRQFSYDANNRINGNTYQYRVRACRATNNCSNFSDIRSIEVRLQPQAPVISTPAPISNTGVYNINWNATNFSTRYELQERRNNGVWQIIHNNAATNKSVTRADGVYIYRVRGCNVDVCSAYSPTQQVTVDIPLIAPAVNDLDSITTTGQYSVSWSPVNNASYYIIEEKRNDEAWFDTNVGSSTFKSYQYSTDSVNHYRIRACKVNNTCGAYSEVKTIIVNVAQYQSDPVATVSDIPAVEAGSAIVSASVGTFQADQMGQATYELPIFAGKGAAGLSPKVSLNYSSVAGNGPLGVGWSVSGISVITRCRDTQETAGNTALITPQPISWNDNDRLCLNGQSLVLVSGANYWDNLSEYRTEMDQFARIKYYRSSNYFTVERKDGSIAYYGDTSDSNIAANVNGTTPTYAWAISQFRDNTLNYINYRYNDLDSGMSAGPLEFVLTDIDYTGHLSNPVVVPYNNIHFTYESNRDDKSVAYIGGAKTEMTLRLAQVESSIDGTEVRSYTLNYDQSDTSGRSLLNSVMECRAQNCLPVMQFDWSEPGNNFSELTTNSQFPTNIKSSKLADVNGDGRADLIFVKNESNAKFRVAFGNGSSGFSVNSNTNLPAPTEDEIDKKWHLIDYNADGRQDIMKQGFNGDWYVHYALVDSSANGVSGFNTVGVNTTISGQNGGDFDIADVNGDGLADIIYHGQGRLQVRYLQRTGNQFGFSSSTYQVNLPSQYQQIPDIDCPANDCLNGHNGAFLEYSFFDDDGSLLNANDVNGDGVADLILKTDIITYVLPNRSVAELDASKGDYLFYSQGKGNGISIRGEEQKLVLSSHWVAFIGNGGDATNGLDFTSRQQYLSRLGNNVSGDAKAIKFIDINADGMTDVMYRTTNSNNNQWQYRLSSGTEFLPAQTIGTIIEDKYMQLFDYNGDGYQDIMNFISTSNPRRYYVRLWNGDGFSNNVMTTAIAENPETNTNFFMDVNGDGRQDHFRIDPQGRQRIYIRQDAYQPVDKITDFTDGLGAKTQILYQPLTFSTVYKQGIGANQLFYGNDSPVFDFLSSMYVVSSVITDAPTEHNSDGTSYMSYQYESARVQTGGRGFLGFEKILTSVPVFATGDASSYLLQTQTTYHQDFPYIGYPKSVVVSQYENTFMPPNNVCAVSPESCFPPPCYPGEICTDPQRGVLTSTLLSESTNTLGQRNTNGASVFAYIASTTEKIYSPESGSLLKTRIQSTTHDNYGNPLVNTVKIYDGLVNTNNLLNTTTTTNTYTNQISNWKIGLMETSSVSVSRPGATAITTDTAYDYNYTTGLLSEERRLPNDSDDKFLRIRHKYDHFGNEIKTISCSRDLSVSQCDNTSIMQSATTAFPLRIHRYNELVMDNKGRYTNSVKNSLGQTVSSVISRDIYGNVVISRDLLNVTTTNNYDVFGQLQSSHSSLGTWSSTSKRWCQPNEAPTYSNCPNGAKIRITKRSQGGGLAYEFIDKLGRTIETREQSFNTSNTSDNIGDERWIVNQQFYDRLGRGTKMVGPYFFGETSSGKIPATYTDYDRYNRVIKTTLPDFAYESISYDGFDTITSNALTQLKTERKNALGEVIEVEDHIGSILSYTYNAQGLVAKIRRTIDVNGTEVEELLVDDTYDKLGRKTISKSVDSGTTTSTYNAEGELVSVTDNKNQIIDTYHDVLGRVYLTEDFDIFGNKTSSKNFIFDATNNLLKKEQDLMSSDGYQRHYFYDNLQRLQLVSVIINDTENVCNMGGLCNFTTYQFYDRHSRSKIEQDASGKAVENHYNNNGFMNLVRNKDNPAKEYYKITKTDARSNIIQDRKSINLFTNYQYDVDRGFMTGISSSAVNTDYAYQYDLLGNIKKRSTANKSECFFYDDLNRLTDSYRFNNQSQNCNNTSGNIEHQHIKFDGRGNIVEKDNQTYTYHTGLANSIGNSPHQVQSKGAQNFVYDDNGNNITTTNFDSPTHGLRTRHIEYTTFDKIERVYLGSLNNPDQESTFKYDTSNNRYVRVDVDANGAKKVTYFIGSTEIEFRNNQSAKYKRQLGDFAIVEEFNGVSTDRYLFTDHLGSIDKITNASGGLVQAMSFSAWGERRTPSDWSAFDWQAPVQQATIHLLSEYTSSGFTGHEMVDAFGIINMGGRIYDAELGRMLQADPFVQDPTNSQSYNRYTYVFNNPLSYTDPSGYFSLRKIIGTIVGAIITFYTGGILGWNVFWAGFAGGFASSIIITGNFKNALKSGLLAGAIAFAGNGFSNEFPINQHTEELGRVAGGAKDVVNSTAQMEAAKLALEDATRKAFKKLIKDVVGQIIQSIDPEAGAVYSFLSNTGNYKDLSAGQILRNLTSKYGNLKASEELERFAKKNGLTLQQLNLFFLISSNIGNKLVGTRFEEDNFRGEAGAQGLRGILTRVNDGIINSDKVKILNKIIGLPFDVIDVALGFQGLITASGYEAIRSGDKTRAIQGFSLGSLDANNLVARGYFSSGISKAFVFGNVAHSNVQVEIGALDIVNGGIFGKLTNPFAKIFFKNKGCIMHGASGCY